MGTNNKVIPANQNNEALTNSRSVRGGPPKIESVIGADSGLSMIRRL